MQSQLQLPQSKPLKRYLYTFKGLKSPFQKKSFDGQTMERHPVLVLESQATVQMRTRPSIKLSQSTHKRCQLVSTRATTFAPASVITAEQYDSHASSLPCRVCVHDPHRWNPSDPTNANLDCGRPTCVVDRGQVVQPVRVAPTATTTPNNCCARLRVDYGTRLSTFALPVSG